MLLLKKTRGVWSLDWSNNRLCVCMLHLLEYKESSLLRGSRHVDWQINNHFVYDILTAAPRRCCTVNHFSDCKSHRIFDQFRALQPSDVLDPEGELLKRIILRERTPLSWHWAVDKIIQITADIVDLPARTLVRPWAVSCANHLRDQSWVNRLAPFICANHE